MTSIVPSMMASHMAGLSSSGTQKPRQYGPFCSIMSQLLVRNIAKGFASAVTARPSALA